MNQVKATMSKQSADKTHFYSVIIHRPNKSKGIKYRVLGNTSEKWVQPTSEGA